MTRLGALATTSQLAKGWFDCTKETDDEALAAYEEHRSTIKEINQ